MPSSDTPSDTPESETVTFNGREYDRDVFETGVAIVRNRTAGGGGLGGAGVASTPELTRWQGRQYGGERDIYDVLGYDSLDGQQKLEKFRQRYNRQDIAARVIDAFPGETWKHPPELVDDGADDPDEQTEFERVANRYIERTLNTYWHRADRAQRLGEYALLMAGFADGQPLSEPVNAGALSSPDDVSFWNVFPQEQVEEWVLGKDLNRGEASNPEHPRYNRPVAYYIDFSDVDAEATDDDFEWVHWHRVVAQPAEGALESDLKGQSALEPIYNRLVDRQKVIGASAEIFYTGADRKIVANVKDDFALGQYDDGSKRQDFKDQLSNLVNDLQQTIVSTGMEYEVLGGEEVDPTGVIDAIDTSIATAIEMPKNMLTGNETGERATTMDRRNWADTIDSRQRNFAAPEIARPTVDRLLLFGIFPEPVGGDYYPSWADHHTPTDEEAASAATDWAAALKQSGLARSLSPQQKLDLLADGPDDIEIEELEVAPPDESDPAVRETFDAIMQPGEADD